MSKYQEHLNRVLAAIRLESSDRVPFVPGGPAVNAAVAGVPLAQYCSDMKINCQANLKGLETIGEVDAVQNTIFQPDILATLWLGEVKVPGRDLGDNELWQMHEKEYVKQEDYDVILEEGFGPWFEKFLVERLGNPLQYCKEFFEYGPTAKKIFADAGYPFISEMILASPFEMFCGGRSFYNFFSEDLLEIPDKVEQVFDVVQAENLKKWESAFQNPETKPLGVWVGGWRGTPGMLNPELFERFSWKYMREIVELCLKYGVIPILHLDSEWTLGLKYIKELPPKSCIVSLDGKTDIFKAKEILGDHSCIMGDVPATLLSFGTPEKVDAYCKKLIEEIGPAGFILGTGCDAPFNAKLENLKAMGNSVKKYAK